MPIDISEHYRPKINALAREQGIPEEIIEPKSIKYGTRYDFPQNMSWDLEENSVMMFNKFRMYMEEKYEEAITQAIAEEAKKEGMTTVVVLDKWKIVKALAAANPEDFPDMVKVVRCKDCKHAIIVDDVFPEDEVACSLLSQDVECNNYCMYGEKGEQRHIGKEEDPYEVSEKMDKEE